MIIEIESLEFHNNKIMISSSVEIIETRSDIWRGFSHKEGYWIKRPEIF